MERDAPAVRWPLLRTLLGALLLLAVLVLPNHPGRLSGALAPVLPVELPLVLGLLLLAPSVLGSALRAVAVALAGALLFVKLADMGTITAFSRPFNLILDAHLFVSGWHLLSGSVGAWQAAGSIALALILFAAVLVLMAWSLRGILGLPRRSRVLSGAGLIAVAALGALILSTERPVGAAPPVSLEATRFAAERARLFAASLTDMADFEADLAVDPVANLLDDTLLRGLAGKDVLFVFVESYGRSAVEGERYRDAVQARLLDVEGRIAGAGYLARSGWLTAPTVGGQSWLAHSALLSGLWTNNQQRYDRLMVSSRLSLNALFRRAGWRSVGVLPAITMDWPEGRWYGYDVIYARDDLGYRGEPFNWVTMPDQYTLSALNRLELDRPGRPRVMAELALISSHAPWTPIPPLLPWEEVGDGTVFTPYALSGDPPSVVWRDPERVREQYALSIDYALETLGSYIESFGSEDLVLLILGDHQPAPLVTAEGASRDVPVHLVSADPAVLSAIEGWNWTNGMVPAGDASVARMDDFRERFLRAFAGP